MTPRKRPLPFAVTDLAVVVGGALSLAIFEGPVSLRKLRACLAGVPSDVSLGKLLAGRVVWAAALAPLFLVLWRLGARELERRRRLDPRVALTAEALPFAPLAVLVLGLLPGWGDTLPEAFSFAMLFLFLGAVAASTSLRVATWHFAFARDTAHRRMNVSIFGACGVGLWLATGLAGPFDVQPHWSTLADRSPYWPSHSYVALWTAWILWLSLPVLALPGELARAGRMATARLLAVGLGSAVVASGLVVASRDRAGWDRRAVAARYVAGGDGDAVLAGQVFAGRVIPVPGASTWTWRSARPAGPAPTRLTAELRFAPLPEAAFWYRSAAPITVEARVTSDGVTSTLATWRLDPRRAPTDRGVHVFERELVALPGRELVFEVHATSALPEPATLPILAAVTVSPAG